MWRVANGLDNAGLEQWFPPFFGSLYPKDIKIFGGIPNCFSRYQDHRIVTIAGTPGTSSRQPGWEYSEE